MSIQLDTNRLAGAVQTPAQDIAAPLNQGKATSAILGGQSVKVTDGSMTDLEKLVARIKNESAATRQSVAQRRLSILSTILDSMADKITASEKANILKSEELNIEKSELQKNMTELTRDKEVMDALIESLDRQIEQAVKDGKEHNEQVRKLERQRAEEQAKLERANESIESVASKIAGVDAKLSECSKAIASSTLNEVYAALRLASGDDKPEAERNETLAERKKADAKNAANDLALHISAALDRIDGQIRAALDAAQMKVEG